MKFFKTPDGKYINVNKIVSMQTNHKGDVFGSLGFVTGDDGSTYGFGTVQLAKCANGAAARQWLDNFVKIINGLPNRPTDTVSPVKVLKAGQSSIVDEPDEPDEISEGQDSLW